MKMKASEINIYKKKLIEFRDKLMDELGRIKSDMHNKSTREASGDLSGYSLHMADQASDNFDREFSLDLAQNEQSILIRIEDALKRIEEKTFGVCMQCKKVITKHREGGI